MNISKLNIDGVTYNIKDEEMRRKSAIHVFNISELKTVECESGNVVKTLGYYHENDGGAGIYLIRGKTENDVEDGATIHFVGDNLVAELIIDGAINIKQFGAKGDGETNDDESFAKALEYCKTHKTNLYIPNGTYILTQTFTINSMFNIYGESKQNTILDFSGITTADTYCFRLSDTYQIANVEYKGFTIKGNREYTIGLSLGRAKYVDGVLEQHISVVESHFSDIALKEHKLGLRMQGAWSNLFDNVLIRNCKTSFAFYDGTTNTVFNNLHCVISTLPSSITNCEHLTFNAFEFCEYDGVGDYIKALTIYQSSVSINGSYFENINAVNTIQCGAGSTSRERLKIENTKIEGAINLFALNEKISAQFINNYFLKNTYSKGIRSYISAISDIEVNNSKFELGKPEKIAGYKKGDLTVKKADNSGSYTLTAGTEYDKVPHLYSKEGISFDCELKVGQQYTFVMDMTATDWIKIITGVNNKTIHDSIGASDFSGERQIFYFTPTADDNRIIIQSSYQNDFGLKEISIYKGFYKE